MQATTHSEPIEQTTSRSQASAQTMRAIVQRAYGSTETLELTETRRPSVAADQVLIEVHAAGVDRGVWHLMTGMPYVVRLMGYGLTRPSQQTPGMDVAGRVVAVGSSVERFAVGDEVFGIARGAYAEYAVAEADKLARKPASVSFEQAAVASISGITALQALTEVAQVAPGQEVLVIGASGGVGSYAVQIARALGGRVTGVASAAKAELVRSLGADTTIDYRAGDYLDGSRRYDLIIDIGGRNSLRRLRRALTRTGTLVIVGGEGGDRLTGGVWRQMVAPLMSRFVSQRLATFVSTEHYRYIEALAGFIERGEVTPAVGRTYRLDEVAAAIDDLTSGQAQGKSAIVVR
ncbi:MAG: NAD(P)-dependent alcohol dehydrogenase [Candidatus Limnocylindrales bacterium]